MLQLEDDRMTPPQLAKRLGVKSDKVRAWIKTGELLAVNVATTLSSRPRYVISEADFQDFEQARKQNKATPRRRKNRNRPGRNQVEFV